MQKTVLQRVACQLAQALQLAACMVAGGKQANQQRQPEQVGERSLLQVLPEQARHLRRGFRFQRGAHAGRQLAQPAGVDGGMAGHPEQLLVHQLAQLGAALLDREQGGM